MLKSIIKSDLFVHIVPFIAAFFLKIIYFTCKVRFHGCDFPNSNAIFITWHGELVMTPFCYKKKSHKNQNVYVLASPHRDGIMIQNTIKQIAKSKSILGSSVKNPAKALIGAMKILKEKNNSIAISPDGPKGPRHSVAQGVVILSQKLHVPIVTVNCKASSCWKFNSWDKMFLPKPFSKIDFYIGEPFYLDGLQLQNAINTVKQKLLQNAFL